MANPAPTAPAAGPLPKGRAESGRPLGGGLETLGGDLRAARLAARILMR